MKPEIRLYIACSIDGYIARKNNSLDWLTGHPVPEGEDYGYGKFIADIDVVVMGRATYQEILGFGVEWPYPNCQTFVFGSGPVKIDSPNTLVLSTLDEASLQKLRAASQKDIWIVGGGKLISSFLNLNAVDTMIISIIPVLLGDGIPLFPAQDKELKFNLLKTESLPNGVVILHYLRKA